MVELQTAAMCKIGGVDFGVLPFYSFHMDGQATDLWQPDWIRCRQHVSAAVSAAAVSARPDLGAIYTNFWHTVATYLSPIFWALLDNEKLLLSLDRPPNIHLKSSVPPAANYEVIFLSGVYPDPGLIRSHNVAQGNFANFFSSIWFSNTNDVKQEDAAVCIDRLDVRSNGDWNPDSRDLHSMAHIWGLRESTGRIGQIQAAKTF